MKVGFSNWNINYESEKNVFIFDLVNWTCTQWKMYVMFMFFFHWQTVVHSCILPLSFKGLYSLEITEQGGITVSLSCQVWTSQYLQLEMISPFGSDTSKWRSQLQLEVIYLLACKEVGYIFICSHIYCI